MSLECDHEIYYLEDADDVYRCVACYQVVDPDDVDSAKEDNDGD